MKTELVAELESCIERGRTLPAHWYFDPEVLDLERELVFKRNWQLFTEPASLEEPGDFATETIAGVPVVADRVAA